METHELFSTLVKSLLMDLREELVAEVAEKVIERIEVDVGENKSYKAKEIIKICNISKATLDRWVKKGLKYTSTGKNTQRHFTIKDINNFKKKKK